MPDNLIKAAIEVWDQRAEGLWRPDRLSCSLLQMDQTLFLHNTPSLWDSIINWMAPWREMRGGVLMILGSWAICSQQGSQHFWNSHHGPGEIENIELCMSLEQVR